MDEYTARSTLQRRCAELQSEKDSKNADKVVKISPFRRKSICSGSTRYFLAQCAHVSGRKIVRLENSCKRPWRFNRSFGCVWTISWSGGALGTGYCSCIFIDCRNGVVSVTVLAGVAGTFSLPTYSYGFSADVTFSICAYNDVGTACSVEVASIGPSPCGIMTFVVAMIFSESFKSMTSTFSS